MLNHVVAWKSWIFHRPPVRSVKAEFMAGHTASEIEAFERAMLRKLFASEMH